MSSTNYQDDDTQEETWETGELSAWLNNDEGLYHGARAATAPYPDRHHAGLALQGWVEDFDWDHILGPKFNWGEVDFEQIADDLWNGELE